MARHALLRTFTGHLSGIGSVAISPDETLVAGGGTNFDPSVRLWNAVLTGSDSVRLWDIRDLLTGLTVIRSGTDLEITWGLGKLEQAETVHGPWESAPETTVSQRYLWH